NRFATFTHAINSTSPTATLSISSAGRADAIICSCRRTNRNRGGFSLTTCHGRGSLLSIARPGGSTPGPSPDSPPGGGAGGGGGGGKPYNRPVVRIVPTIRLISLVAISSV